MKKLFGVLLVLSLVLSVCLVTTTPMAAATGPPVTGGLVLHLDADSIEGLSDGDAVAQWDDMSGEDNQASQPTPANRPSYRTDVLNGSPVIRFDGSSTFMLVPPILDPAQDNWSFFAVVTPAAMTNQDIWQQLDGTTGPGRVNVSIRTVAATTQYSSFLGGSQRPSGIGVVATRSNLITQTWDGMTLAWWGDGTAGSTHTPTAEPANGGYHIGVNKGITGNWLDGDIAEILIYDRALANSERQQVEQYLGVKWLSTCVATATGTGTACFYSSQGTIVDLQAVEAVSPAPRGVGFPHGMFEFKITGLTPGAGETVTLTIELPEAVPVGTVWWKYQDGDWYSLPNETDDGDNIMTILLTDGGLGDTGDEDGTIADPGGPGNPMPPLTVGWEGSSVDRAAVVAPWLALLAGIITGASLLLRRRLRV